MPFGEQTVELPRSNLPPPVPQLLEQEVLGHLLLVVLQQDIAAQLGVKMTAADRRGQLPQNLGSTRRLLPRPPILGGVEHDPQALHHVSVIASENRAGRNMRWLQDVRLMDLQLFGLLPLTSPAPGALLSPAAPFADALLLIQCARLDLRPGLFPFQNRHLVLSLRHPLFQQGNALLLPLTHLQHQL